MKHVSRRLLVLVSLLCLLAPSARAQSEGSDRHWLEGMALVTLDSEDPMSLQKARKHIQDSGGRVAILSPPNLILGWIDRELESQLVGEANIRSVHFDPVMPYEIEAKDVVSRSMVTWFNRAISGEYEAQVAADRAKEVFQDWPKDFDGDAFATPGFDVQAYEQNLREKGYDVELLREQGLLKNVAKGNSDAMSGTIAVQLFFVESDGSGADPDQYTWTEQAVQDYVAGVNTGLAWWSLKATQYRDCWAAFLVRYFEPTDPRCQQWREMVLHPSGDVGSMASEIMGNFGYNSGGVFTRVEAFNTDLRLTYGTDRSYSAFIAYNPLGAPDRLTDGRSAFAYLLGPYTFLLYRSYSWQPDQVFTHESGHIFGACDEYDGGCSCAGNCTNGEPNYNCELCANSRPCMMNANNFTLCQYTDAHVGWRLQPTCAPPALPAPVLAGISPSSGAAGETYDVTVTGSNLVWGAALDLGEYVTVNSSQVIDANTMVANITVGSLADPGLRPASLTNRDLQTDELFDAFAVIPSLRHYVSSAGTNEYPYTTPGSAAHSFAAVLDAAAAGDSVLVGPGNFNVFALDLDRPLKFYGGYSGDFSTRDKVLQRTGIDLTQGILVTADVVLDGFEIFGGKGTVEYLPDEAHFGGAIAVRNASLTLTDCDLHDNDAIYLATGLAAGGAIHATDATLNLQGNIFRDNRSYTGGALHLERVSGTIADNTFVTNLANDQFTGDKRGGAVYVVDSSGLTLSGNVFQQNSSGAKGGAMYVSGCTAMTIEGGSFDTNQSPIDGAGVYVEASDLLVDGVTFDGNVAGGSGGGFAAGAATTVRVTNSTFTSNSALLGGAVFSTAADATLDHGLFVGNSATAAGAAIYATGLLGGAVEANTFHGNSHPSPASAAVLLVSSPVAFRHNIVSENAAVGVFCSGAPAATAGINLAWNNAGGDFQGCVPTDGWIVADPLFVDAAGGDFHLGLHSPAIDAGDPDPAFADVDGSAGDLGRYGAGSASFEQPSRPTNLTGLATGADVQLQWDASPAADVVSYAVYASSAAGFVPSAAELVAQVNAPATSATLGAISEVTHYRVSALDADGYASGYAAELSLDPEATAVGETPTPLRTQLSQNQPNPFNPRTVLRYEIAEGGPVRLAVYDVTGRLVVELVSAERAPGRYDVVWAGEDSDGHRVPSGVYFYRLVAPGFEQTNKMTLLK